MPLALAYRVIPGGTLQIARASDQWKLGSGVISLKPKTPHHPQNIPIKSFYDTRC